MKIVAISDTHGHKPYIPECDILIHGGDVSPMDDHSRAHQKNYLFDEFIPWLKSLPARHVVFIAGNHDFYLEEAFETEKEGFINDHCGQRVSYIRDAAVEIDGTIIYGTPWIPTLSTWAFYRKDKTLDKIFQGIPKGIVDILISHGPPYGACDTILEYGDTTKIGCKPLSRAIIEREPKRVICGHIHSGRHDWEALGKSMVRNVSVLDEQYNPAYPPLVFEI